MPFKDIDQNDIQFFQSFLDDSQIHLREEELKPYGRDETEDFSFPPQIVLKPSSTEEVSKILAYCNLKKIAVTTRGGGTGLSGGALPVYGGLVLSTEKLNRILWIDDENFQVCTQPGVITEVLQNTLARKNLFYPPDPASKGSCFIGGNVAENSGGPKALKYGVVKDYVLNLEIVLANGEVIWTAANVLKNATGYNLSQLIVGSEGTLAIVTQIVLRLIPLPSHDITFQTSFTNAGDACSFVAKVFQSGLSPSALEFMERDAILYTYAYVNREKKLGENVGAQLLIEFDGFSEREIMEQAEKLQLLLEEEELEDVLVAQTKSEKDQLWEMRRKVGEAVKAQSIYKEEDTVVPRSRLPELLSSVKEIGTQHGFQSICYGHAGDGNLHVNIIKGKMNDEDWKKGLESGIQAIFKRVAELGGTISGEHGIGWVQKNYMPIVFNSTQLGLLKGIKDLFDPKGILNPGKIFPD